MSLSDEERDTLVMLQIEKALKHLNQADTMYKMQYFDMAANRYYYACFHALHALLIRHGYYCHTHAGLISAFGKHFIKTGLIDPRYGRFVSRLEQLREKGDYNCLYDIEECDVKDMVDPSHDLISLIQEMIFPNQKDILKGV